MLARSIDQGIPKQNSLSLVHAEVYRQDLFDTPIGHRVPNQNSAPNRFIPTLFLSGKHRAQFSNGDTICRVDPALHEVACIIGFDSLGRVIRLLRPRLFNELDATSFHDDKLAFAPSEHN